MTRTPLLPSFLDWTRSLSSSLPLILLIAAPTTAAPEWSTDRPAYVTCLLDGNTFDTGPDGRVRLADIDAPSGESRGLRRLRLIFR